MPHVPEYHMSREALVSREELPTYRSTAEENQKSSAFATSTFLTSPSAPSPLSSSDIGELELNEIYKIMGTGLAQKLIWLLTGIISYTEYAELTMLSLVILELRCEWGLTADFETILTVSVIIVYSIFALIAGKLADKFGRRQLFIYTAVGLLGAATASALVSNMWAFLVLRSLAGGFIGMNVVVASCYAVEFAESNYRIVGISMFSLAGYCGLVAVNLVAWALLATVGWRWFIVLLTAPGVPAVFLALYLPESPRYLCVKGEHDKAMQAVRFMARLNKTSIPDDVRMICHEHQDTGSYRDLISTKHWRSTISLAIMFSMNIFAEFGIVLFLPLYFSSDVCGVGAPQPTHQCTTLSQSDLVDLSLAALSTMVGAIVALLTAHFVGRLYPIRIGSFLQAFFQFLLFFCVNKQATIWQAILVRFFIAVNNTFIWVMMPESYPTSIRSTAVGVINCLAKVGGIVGTGSVFLFFYIDPDINLGFFFSASLLGLIGALVFNKRTKEINLTET